jgi:arginase
MNTRVGMTHQPIDIVGAEVGEGASDSGCKWGSGALREHGIQRALSATGRSVRWTPAVAACAQSARSRMEAIASFSRELAMEVGRVLEAGHMPLVLGGDHSCAVGTWSAVAEHLRPQGRLGLIWVDAHLDAHTPQTSESQAPHGMPLAALLGEGAPVLTQLFGWRGKLRAQDVVVIGARSFEPAERALLERLGVRVMFMDEVLQRGFEDCFSEACALVQRHTAGWGLSFDLDGLDPLDAPGTGTPVDVGIRLADAVKALAQCGEHPRFVAMELTEYNPLRDFGGRTAQAATQLVCAALAPATQAVDIEL